MRFRQNIASRAIPLTSAGAGPQMLRTAIRQLVPLLAAVLFLFLLRDRIAAIDLDAVSSALRRITPYQWVVAAGATTISFAALGQYDVVVHRILRIHSSSRSAKRAGMSAIAISQVLGFGLVTGSLVRWRLLPGLSLWQATRLTSVVTALFLCCWALISAFAVLLLPSVSDPLGSPAARATALSVLALGLGAMGAAFLYPRVSLAGRALTMPSLPALLRLLMLTGIDTFAAALALWVLTPDMMDISAAQVIPAYLLALGAGLVLATPGGLGPFELALVALLPSAPQDPLLAAVLAYRLVYFAAPAALAALTLMFCFSNEKPCARAEVSAIGAPTKDQPPHLNQAIRDAARAEVGIFMQGEHSVLWSNRGQNGWLTGRGGQSLVALFDPFQTCGQTASLIADLNRAARAEARVPCLYKCSARTAVAARTAGYFVWPAADELWLDPRKFDLSAPKLSGLRRKLRKAAKAGIDVARATPNTLPLAEMTRIATEWSVVHGGERGFSMGRYTPQYVAGQRVYLAHQAGQLVGFATFHEGAREWVLDLMRGAEGAPDGTMHALICAALADATPAKLPRMSLAAVPCRADALKGLPACVFKWASTSSGAAGLSQFKTGFAPHRQRLYIAAPSRIALGLCAADITRQIHVPARAQSASFDPNIWAPDLTAPQ
ncbi:MAG: phosphatidylglycerol lysyltransferase domain-containing protein [Albidovulum sp.]